MLSCIGWVNDSGCVSLARRRLLSTDSVEKVPQRFCSRKGGATLKSGLLRRQKTELSWFLHSNARIGAFFELVCPGLSGH